MTPALLRSLFPKSTPRSVKQVWDHWLAWQTPGQAYVSCYHDTLHQVLR